MSLPMPRIHGNDLIGPLDTYDIQFITSVPEKKESYRTVTRVFDGYIWASLLASLLTVTTVLITINKIYERWYTGSPKEDAYHGEIEPTI